MYCKGSVLVITVSIGRDEAIFLPSMFFMIINICLFIYLFVYI